MGEVWALNGGWIRTHRPDFGPGIRERYQQAAETSPEQVSPRCARARDWDLICSPEAFGIYRPPWSTISGSFAPVRLRTRLLREAALVGRLRTVDVYGRFCCYRYMVQPESAVLPSTHLSLLIVLQCVS